tara:strand:+ start:1013 stop:1246 length:234 start_codon:yes stop_codon:yes gene_type:complete
MYLNLSFLILAIIINCLFFYFKKQIIISEIFLLNIPILMNFFLFLYFSKKLNTKHIEKNNQSAEDHPIIRSARERLK